ncbi:MAG: gamma-glutamyl-phosphate reductase, partial [bacterium]
MATKTSTLRETVAAQARAAKAAALKMQGVSTAQKNQALEFLAQALERNHEAILAENRLDVEEARRAGVKPAFLERLTLNAGRLVALAQSVRNVTGLADPVGEITARIRRPNGLRIVQVRVPIGVIAFIYESRPNVTVDAAVLCVKA